MPEVGQRCHPLEFFDFGVRRLLSDDWYREVVATLTREVPECFRGTSKVLLAGPAPDGATAATSHPQTHRGACTHIARRSEVQRRQ